MAKPAKIVSDLQPYPAYKPSGVEWLGKVPAHWEVLKLGRMGTLSKGNGGSKADEVPVGVPCVRYGDLYTTHSRFVRSSRAFVSVARAADYTRLKHGDVLFAASGETLDEIGTSAVNLMLSEACCGGDIIVFRPKYRTHAPFMGYVTDCWSSAIQKATMGKGFTVVHIYATQLKHLVLPVPPIPEQAAIARFLDHADRRIRLCIQAKEQLVKLLEEQRQAIVNEAVTGQIDVRTGRPYPAYKVAGVDWLGEVPEHWQRARLKTVLRPVDRRSDTGAETLLSLRRDHGIVVYAEHFTRPSQSSSLVGFKLVTTGQLVVNRLQANNGLVFCSRLNGLVSPDYSVFEMRTALNMEYLSDLLRTSIYRAHFRREATGLGTGTAGFLRLYDDKFLETPVFLPSAREQVLICKSLARHAAKVGRLIDRVQRQIRLFGEFRVRLIADIVTGRLDIREVGARLPDKIGELESFAGSAAQTNIGDESNSEVNAAAWETEA